MVEPTKKIQLQAPKEKTRTAILEAARTVFSENGYHNANVSDIIQKVGMAQGSFYNYFPSKKSIFIELLENFTQKLVDALEKYTVENASDRDTYSAMAIGIASTVSIAFTEDAKLAKIFFWEANGIESDITEILEKAYLKITKITERFMLHGQKMGILRDDIPADVLAAADVGISIHMIKEYLSGRLNQYSKEKLLFFNVGIQLGGMMKQKE